MIGTTLEERFRVDEHLIQQGSVEIFTGVALEEGLPVWVKRISPPVSRDDDFVDSWRAQMLSIQAVEDEHLPKLFAYGRLPDGTLYQVEEIPHGIALRRYTAKHAPMSAASTVRLLAAMARAVGVAHREGVAHGALNPENLYVTEGAPEQAQPFVTGWEAGEMVISLRRMGEAIPDRLIRYLAPEQLKLPIPPVTPASDVYSLGIILYEMLTGSLPTGTPDANGFIELPSPRRFNPDISPIVEQVLLRALNPDPATRPPNGLALASALLQALESPAAPPPPAPPVDERIERVTTVPRPSWMRLAAGALIGLLLCVILLLVQQLNRNRTPIVAGEPTPLIKTVPNLVGPPFLRYNEAVTLAWNQGYVVNIVGFRSDANLPPGVVVMQCPLAGALPGSFTECAPAGILPIAENTILVEVSSLPEPTVLRVVPDLYGQPEQEARTALEAGGLRLGIRRTAYDMLIPAGLIIEQNPRRGLAVMPGTSVDIIVSGGAPPTSGDLPVSPPVTAPPTATAENLALPTATQAFLPTPTLAPEPTPTTLPSSPILLEDNFEQGNPNEWRMQEGPDEGATIIDGVLRAQILGNDLFWKSQTLGRTFNNYRYRATVRLPQGSEATEGGAGLLARIQDDQHFYFFEIRGDGFWRLRARNGDIWEDLLVWTSDPSIRPAGEANVLEIQAEGERLTLFINGSQVSAGVDTPPPTYLSGDVGFGVETTDSPLIVEFDDVLVTTP